jgi:hypothetical protein
MKDIQKTIDIRQKIRMVIPETVRLGKDTRYNRPTPVRLPLDLFPSSVRLYLVDRDGKWTCAHGLGSPARLSKRGNIECMSHDGKNCIVTHATACKGLLHNPPGKLKTLQCGDAHMKKWGISGYETGHWCDNTRNMIITGAKAVLVHEKKHEILALGKMKAHDFVMETMFTGFLPVLKTVERSIKCIQPTLGQQQV